MDYEINEKVFGIVTFLVEQDAMGDWVVVPETMLKTLGIEYFGTPDKHGNMLVDEQTFHIVRRYISEKMSLEVVLFYDSGHYC